MGVFGRFHLDATGRRNNPFYYIGGVFFGCGREKDSDSPCKLQQSPKYAERLAIGNLGYFPGRTATKIGVTYRLNLSNTQIRNSRLQAELCSRKTKVAKSLVRSLFIAQDREETLWPS
jgi:hypothetical protein